MQSASNESDRMYASTLLAQDMMPERMDSARILLEGAHPLRKSRVLSHQAQYYNVWGLYYWFGGDRLASIDWFKKTLALPNDRTILPLQAAAANNTGGHYFRMGYPDSARVYLQRSLQIDMELDNETGMAKTYYDLSRLHRSMDQHELALRYINEAIRIQNEDGDKQRLMHSYNVLGNALLNLKQREQAAEAYELSQVYARELGNEEMTVLIYSNLSSIWCTMEDGFEKTRHYFELGIGGARESGDNALEAVLLTNMGQAWLTAGNPGRALELFHEAMELIYPLNDSYKEMDVSHRMGKAHRELGDHEKARLAQQRSLEISTARQSPGYQSKALLEMAALDSLESNYVCFARNYVEGIALRDSFWNRENSSRIAELQIVHETEQKALEIEQLKQRQRVRQLRMMIVIAGSGLVFMLLLIAILYVSRHQKLIRHKYVMRHLRVEAELEANRRELTGKALSLAKSDQLLTKLKNDLQTMLIKTDGGSCEDIRSALCMLQSKDNSRQLWAEFETRFNELNEGFITRLSSRHPCLSPSEIRLCAMLRLHLSTKDIAEMIKRSTRTIEHTRTSIRKKMKLQPCDNLVQHLLSI